MKTIEEIAVIEAANYDNPFDEPAYDKKFYDGFLAGANYLLSRPLAERITAEEREKIKAIYSRNVYRAEDNRRNLTEKCLIDALFGSELFAEKGGKNGNF